MQNGWLCADPAPSHRHLPRLRHGGSVRRWPPHLRAARPPAGRHRSQAALPLWITPAAPRQAHRRAGSATRSVACGDLVLLSRAAASRGLALKRLTACRRRHGGGRHRPWPDGDRGRLRPECTRSVRLDLEWLAYHGHAREPLPALRHRCECLRLPRCELTWIESHPAGAPLQCFVGDPNTWLSVLCEGCGAARPFTFERMIRALQAAGRGDGNTSVRDVGERLKRPCKDCPGVRWRVEIVREHALGRARPRLSNGRGSEVAKRDAHVGL